MIFKDFKIVKIILITSLYLVSSFGLSQTGINENLLREIEKKGEEIYLRDMLASAATDVVTIERLQSSNTRGWITIQDESDWVVRFVGEEGGNIYSYFDVTLNIETRTANVQENQAGELIPPSQEGAWKARQIASTSDFRTCTDRYNAVVLSSTENNKPIWLVYLLAATTDLNLIVIGGHHRVTVSADGSTIIKNEPLSKSCLNLEVNTEAVALTVTHLLSPEPIETHVFSSLLYQTPIYVGTSLGVFSVEGANIRFVEER